MTDTFVKHVSFPAGYVAWEAAGLRWLAAADEVAVAEVVSVDDARLVLRRVHECVPSAAAAEAFGAGLARLHASGAVAHGVGPDGWSGDGWLGPSDQLLPLPLRSYDAWGAMYAETRLLPTAEAAHRRGHLTDDDLALVERVCERLRDGDFDTDDPPARLHGDLWSGNVLWADDGVVLIDPAAHGGHRETDLGLLTLFGAPHLDRTIAAYDATAPLASGWADRVGLHQLHPLLVHSALFGGSFIARMRETAARYA